MATTAASPPPQVPLHPLSSSTTDRHSLHLNSGASGPTHGTELVSAQLSTPLHFSSSAVAAPTTSTTCCSLSASPLRIEEMLKKGVQKQEVNVLRQSGYSTVESVAFASQRALLAVRGMSEQRYARVKQAARELVGMGFCLASAYLEARENLIRFTTGSSQLDTLLGGGIETGALTELFGEFRTGKTQLCHTLAVTCQLPIDQQGAEGKCLWIDTEGTFRPERIVRIAERFQLRPPDVLDNIIYGRAYNTDHQLELLIEASALMVESRFALLIVDSATALYRAEYLGRNELAARQNHLLRFLRALQKIADTFGVAVILCNQVCARVDIGMSHFVRGGGGSDKIPIGGHIMAHSTQTRLSLRKGRGTTRICRVYDSPSLPESECPFEIEESGVCDSRVPPSGSRGGHRAALMQGDLPWNLDEAGPEDDAEDV